MPTSQRQVAAHVAHLEARTQNDRELVFAKRVKRRSLLTPAVT